jgi:hypothetical protein
MYCDELTFNEKDLVQRTGQDLDTLICKFDFTFLQEVTVPISGKERIPEARSPPTREQARYQMLQTIILDTNRKTHMHQPLMEICRKIFQSEGLVLSDDNTESIVLA